MGAASPRAEQDGGGVISDINVTPLVDVTLVLLIIMMVAAPILANNQSIKVELPKAATGDDTRNSTLALTLAGTAGGYTLYVNGERKTESELRALLPELGRKDPELQVIIAADKRIAYGDVVHVVDLVKSLGVQKFALNTDPSP